MKRFFVFAVFAAIAFVSSFVLAGSPEVHEESGAGLFHLYIFVILGIMGLIAILAFIQIFSHQRKNISRAKNRKHRS